MKTFLEETKIGTLKAGEIQTINFLLPNGMINGTYFLYFTVENHYLSEKTSSARMVEIFGSTASITSGTNNAFYSQDQLVTISTNITDLSEEITDALLRLQITSTVPAPPKKCVIPINNLYVTENTVFCPGTYTVNDIEGDGAIIISSPNIKVQGNNTILIGNSGTAIKNQGFDGLTIKNMEIQGYLFGIYILDSNNNKILKNTVQSTLIRLDNSSYNTISDNTVNGNNNGKGISIYGESNQYSVQNILTNNVANNNYDGFYIRYSSNNLLSNNTANFNIHSGFALQMENSTIHNNTANSNEQGIALISGNNNTYRNNTMNNNIYNFYLALYFNADLSPIQDIDLSNTVDGKPIYWIYKKSDLVINYSSNAGYVGVIDSKNITIKDLVLTKNNQGILFHNVSKSRIENITVSDAGAGIFIGKSQNSTVKNSLITSNENGIWIDDSFNNSLIGNVVKYNTIQGIRIYNSHNNTLQGNTASNNQNVALSYISGIYLRLAENNTILNNEVKNNKIGIFLHYQNNNNTITNNIITSNQEKGLDLYFSDNNKIFQNTIKYTRTGMFLRGSKKNVIFNNTIDSASSWGGIYLESSSNQNNLVNNTLSNSNYGIRLYFSSNNTILNNTVKESRYHGIILGNSKYNELINNTAVNNLYSGIDVADNSDSNKIIGNKAISNRESGLILVEANYNEIQNNTIIDNKYGLYISSSRKNILKNNAMNNNEQNFGLFGPTYKPYSFDNDIDVTNTVNGKPIYYVMNASDVVFNSLDAGTFYCINCNNVTISGLNLTYNSAGVLLFNTNFSIVKNNFVSNTETALHFLVSNFNEVSNNTVLFNENGLYLKDSSNNQVFESYFSNNTSAGIHNYADDNYLFNNTFYGNQDGVYLAYNTNNNTVLQNTFSYGANGIQFGFAHNSTISNNIIQNQTNYGIDIGYSSTSNTITKNSLTGNKHGIYLYKSTGNNISYNNVSSSGLYGIYISFQVRNNTFRENILSGN
ncbi:MAG: NosD domain-containing protein, partial [Candidatus Kariarchaeaceae archaeon]